MECCIVCLQTPQYFCDCWSAVRGHGIEAVNCSSDGCTGAAKSTAANKVSFLLVVDSLAASGNICPVSYLTALIRPSWNVARILQLLSFLETGYILSTRNRYDHFWYWFICLWVSIFNETHGNRWLDELLT